MSSTGTPPKTSRILQIIQNHYSTAQAPIKYQSPDHPQQQWLIPSLIPFSRWYTMPPAFIIQFCCGSLYSWSIFNKPIDTLIYGDGGSSSANMAYITFYIAIGLLGLSGAIMGPWLERNGPRAASLLGGFLFCCGNLLAALALYFKQIWLVYLGYGVVAGFGIGLCYISPVSCLQKWFPDRRGLASGVAVSGFGAGSIVSAKLGVILMDSVGLVGCFVVMGLGYFICIFLSSLVLRNPVKYLPPKSLELTSIEISREPVNNPEAPTLISCLTSRDFRLLYISFLSNILFGLLAISRLSNMITDIFAKSPSVASTIVSLNGMFNLSGRLIFPLLSDYIGRKNTYTIMLTTQLIILTGFTFVTVHKSYPLFLVSMFVISICYGGGFGSIPAFLTDKFGEVNVGATHGVILTAWSLAGILGGFVFTIVFKVATEVVESQDDPYPYNVNVWWMIGVVTTGWISMMFVKGDEKR